jgi:hypothetical protein
MSSLISKRVSTHSPNLTLKTFGGLIISISTLSPNKDNAKLKALGATVTLRTRFSVGDTTVNVSVKLLAFTVTSTLKVTVGLKTELTILRLETDIVLPVAIDGDNKLEAIIKEATLTILFITVETLGVGKLDTRLKAFGETVILPPAETDGLKTERARVGRGNTLSVRDKKLGSVCNRRVSTSGCILGRGRAPCGDKLLD